MYLANLSRKLGWFYLMILTLDLFGSRYYVLERSIYWDALSFVKRLLALRILNTRKLLQKLLEALWMSWMWLLCLLLGHFSGSCMQTLFFCEGRTHLFAGSELEEEIARATRIVFQPNRLMFKEWSIVTLCIESLSMDVVRSLSFSSVNNFDFCILILQVEKRGHTSSFGFFSLVACRI